jgi:hypothetical protein
MTKEIRFCGDVDEAPSLPGRRRSEEGWRGEEADAEAEGQRPRDRHEQRRRAQRGRAG